MKNLPYLYHSHSFMRIIFSLCFIFLVALPATGQVSVQQKALNNYVDHLNQSASEMAELVSCLIRYYPELSPSYRQGVPRFKCPLITESFYYDKAMKESNSLGSSSAALTASIKEFQITADNIQKLSQSLDTYHKLEDYKKDNFEGARKMVNEIGGQLKIYSQKQFKVITEIQKLSLKLVPAPEAYKKTATMMLSAIEEEKRFLDLWKYNLISETHTGWVVPELEQSILKTDAMEKQFSTYKPILKYPASSMVPSFHEALVSVLEVKRNGLDEYNHEGKKSDHHSNEVYLSLINYYNGTLVADYNAFIGYASADGYYGVKAVNYVPLFEIRTREEKHELIITPYRERTFSGIAITPQKSALSKPIFVALTAYVDYINETWRQMYHHRDIILNLNSSAAYYSTVTSFKGKGGMSFRHDSFVLPKSQYQKVVTESKSLPPGYAQQLNQRAEEILDILREVDEIGSVLEQETVTKQYENDGVKNIYRLLERNKLLYDQWNLKKEAFYDELVQIYSSYPQTDPKNSWIVSGKALSELTSFDKEALFTARKFYLGDGSVRVNTSKLDEKVRDVIAKQYENMKGIQKIGRYNGLCPYTPYEDLPVRSKQLSELVNELKPAQPNTDRYQHPYYSMIYQYNDIVDYHNKFSELAPVPLLKTVKQIPLMEVKYPRPRVESTDQETRPVPVPVAVNTQETRPAIKPEQTKEPVSGTTSSTTQLLRDTVYIEKRDTIYLHDNLDMTRSMEGYAVNNLVLLLDVSGSMNAADKLPMLKQSVLDLISMMRPEDELSIVIFSGKPKIILPSASFRDEDKIRKSINALSPSGKTDGAAGLKLAYKVADGNYLRGGNNRILLATDGEFTVNDEVKELIRKFSTQDIYLSIFNFGKMVSSAKTLENLALTGKGNYEYISRQNIEGKLMREVKAKKSR